MSKPMVAVAGGTGPGMGRAVVRALIARGRYTPVVLGRQSSKTPQWLSDLGVEVRRVDYFDEETIVPALEGVQTESNINGVVSTLAAEDGTWCTIQLNLLNATLKAGIKRFIPSEYGIGPAATSSIKLFAEAQIPVRDALTQAASGDPEFEWTAIYPGVFMNYLGRGSEKEPSPPRPDDLVLDVAGMKAEVPVLDEHAPSSKITLTTIEDIGRFTAAVLELPKGSWTPDSFAAGQTLTLDEIVTLIEQVRGGKMEVTWKTVAEYDRDIAAQDESTQDGMMTSFWMQVHRLVGLGKEEWTVMPPDLNRKLDVVPESVEEYLRRVWG